MGGLWGCVSVWTWGFDVEIKPKMTSWPTEQLQKKSDDFLFKFHSRLPAHQLPGMNLPKLLAHSEPSAASSQHPGRGPEAWLPHTCLSLPHFCVSYSSTAPLLPATLMCTQHVNTGTCVHAVRSRTASTLLAPCFPVKPHRSAHRADPTPDPQGSPKVSMNSRVPLTYKWTLFVTQTTPTEVTFHWT